MKTETNSAGKGSLYFNRGNMPFPSHRRMLDHGWNDWKVDDQWTQNGDDQRTQRDEDRAQEKAREEADEDERRDEFKKEEPLKVKRKRIRHIDESMGKE